MKGVPPCSKPRKQKLPLNEYLLYAKHFSIMSALKILEFQIVQQEAWAFGSLEVISFVT